MIDLELMAVLVTSALIPLTKVLVVASILTPLPIAALLLLVTLSFLADDSSLCAAINAIKKVIRIKLRAFLIYLVFTKFQNKRYLNNSYLYTIIE
jgi:hypothetical protein